MKTYAERRESFLNQIGLGSGYGEKIGVLFDKRKINIRTLIHYSEERDCYIGIPITSILKDGKFEHRKPSHFHNIRADITKVMTELKLISDAIEKIKSENDIATYVNIFTENKEIVELLSLRFTLINNALESGFTPLDEIANDVSINGYSRSIFINATKKRFICNIYKVDRSYRDNNTDDIKDDFKEKNGLDIMDSDAEGLKRLMSL